MTIDWRSLLDEIRVPWVDRGKNVSRGNINIGCPFCGDDPSEHLSISETKDAYYCYRVPGQHSGTSVTRLLTALGVDYWDASDIANRHNSSVVAVAAKPVRPQSDILRQWQKFEPAAESSLCLKYLSSRGFPTPVSTCRQYDLRCAAAGRWAQRLLLPIYEDAELVTWVGRALRAGIDPKYYLEPVSHPVIYLPRPVRETLIVVEGSLDALKIAVATDQRPVSVVALLGKGLSPTKLLRIAELAVNCHRVLVALDDDVSVPVDAAAITDTLDNLATLRCPVDRLALPYGVHDPGDLSCEDIAEWLV